ncbi:hypothetical protein F3Y22_tig00020682pilonHSYRG00004 [Hibiscus syriacus]|uniref:PUB 12/19-like N-terminal domain-containing protein n=1 Tax=Hibiscus syriacus TaxID=106335 RepID=A0A6A3BTZ3_HIBSY|nr:hypothetical protein F3Y22_tig00020682pilonHSYRG00004 [Hibiscus syriacus]
MPSNSKVAILFKELLRDSVSNVFFTPSTLPCFEEMYIVLQRTKALIEDCSNGSKMLMLMQISHLANSFHELTLELSTVLDIFPVEEFDLSQDVEELVVLLQKQCSKSKPWVDLIDDSLMRDVLALLDLVKEDIVPDHLKLKQIFEDLGLIVDSSCREEISSLQQEIQNQIADKSNSEIVSLSKEGFYAEAISSAISSA